MGSYFDKMIRNSDREERGQKPRVDANIRPSAPPPTPPIQKPNNPKPNK